MYSLLFGNCLDKMQEIPDESMDMILADLPYGTSRNTWDVQIPMNPLWEQIERVIKKHGAIVLHAQGMFTADLMQSNRKLWRYNLVWQKTQPTGFLNANRMPMRAHEDICVFYKAPPVYNPQKTYGHERKVSTAEHKRGSRKSTDYGDYKLTSYDSTERYPTSVLRFATDKQKSAVHSTQKPVALEEWLIKSYTQPGQIVLDMCMGSGSTGVAAISTGRSFIGIEIEPAYYAIATRRIMEAEEMYGE